MSSGGTVWIADEGAPAAYRLDGLDSQPRSLSLGGSSGSQAVAATPTAIWLLRKSGELTRADLGTGLQTALPVEGSPTEIAVGSDGLWLVDPDGRVVRSIDPGTGRTIATVPVGGHPSHAVESDGALWVTISDD